MSPMAPSTTASVEVQSPAASTPPTSPDAIDPSISSTMQKEEERMQEARRKQDQKRSQALEVERKKDIESDKEVLDSKYKALEYLLSQSKLYSTIMLSQMQAQEASEAAKDEKAAKKAQKKEAQADQAATTSQRRVTRGTGAAQSAGAEAENGPRKSLITRGQGKDGKDGKEGKISDYLKKGDVEAKAGKTSITDVLKEEADSDTKPGEIGMQQLRSAKQPDSVTGGLMRTYQLEGLEWLTSLYENGLNGILADEMGLGKTIQTISFLAFLREKGVYGPFLVAAPLSTTSNWVAEFAKWTPSIPVVLYHGSKPEREQIRRRKLKQPGSESFPVIITSYEICMNDRKHLASLGWKFIIIDEGHRIKNLDCRLIRELQSYQSANRLLITGTPLQNNLSELWSLLHFLMPNIFDKLESFESWFDFAPELSTKRGYEDILSEERKKGLVTSLHAILKPFLLRRVKTDVETSLPKKREYVLYAPLTSTQRELYQAILDGNGRTFLEEKAVESLSRANTPASAGANSRSASLKRKAIDHLTCSPSKSAKMSRASTPATTVSTGSARSGRPSRRAVKSQNYEELNDTAYFKQLENQCSSGEEKSAEPDLSELEAQSRANTLALAKKMVGSKKLQNPLMQLRLCCDSPHNFYYPFTAEDDSDIDETLITESGKMLLLDRLLVELLKKGHKILIFSQFKTQLDLLQTYCESLRAWSCCRIDGSIPQSERQEQILAFNNPKSKTNVFLLSTRAGGQGINLAAADTVILYDSDWNPQQDLQAQDRAHRIGQTRPVIVYRLATRNTVEEILLEKADSKRRLEKLVIQKGRFRSSTGDAAASDFRELQALLSKDDGERLDIRGEGKDIISDEELKILTDRSDEAYERAEKGMEAGGETSVFKSVETKGGGDGLLSQMSK
ncbi:putative ATPase [Elasticomyces elasticus]|nr:putative ATPase [Elasticomyces elasticus]